MKNLKPTKKGENIMNRRKEVRRLAKGANLSLKEASSILSAWKPLGFLTAKSLLAEWKRLENK